jgi:peptide/nickel transport system substrate-binding protein
MNRAPSVEAFFGDLAVVIERPMTTILPEYPHDAEEVYGYSVESALERFEAAGYRQENGVLVDENGNQFSYNIFIAGGGVGDHPVSPMLTQARDDVASLGGELIIQDVPFNVLQGAMNDGTADMFTLAWSDVFNADKTTQFHTTGGQNRFNVSTPRMDSLLEQINQELDLTARTALVAEMLDYAMELVIEFPVYQRQNLLAFNTRYLNTDALPANSTPFFNYENVLWQLSTSH